MRVVAFGTYDDAVHPRTRVLTEGLAAHGVEVRELNVPLDLSTAERVRMLEAPSRLPALLLRLSWCWLRLAGLRIRTRTAPDAVLVGYLGHFDVVLARVLFPRTPVVLDYLVSAADTATDRRAQGGMRLALMGALDRIACRCADVVLVDTVDSLDTVPSSLRDRALVVPVGAPSFWFREPPAHRGGGPLRVVFFGLFTPLQGAPVVLEALRLAQQAGLQVEATIIGDGQDRAAARVVAPDRGVTWRSWVEPEDLPVLVADHDVCLGIFGDTPKALRVVPNKAYQGAAAGCLVITSDTPAQRRALPSVTRFTAPGDPVALARVLGSLPTPPELLDVRRASHDEARRTIDPASCVAPLLERLRDRAGRQRGAAG